MKTHLVVASSDVKKYNASKNFETYFNRCGLFRCNFLTTSECCLIVILPIIITKSAENILQNDLERC